MKLTTASYCRPSGKNIHRFPDSKESDVWGVMPDAGYDLRLSDGEMSSLVTDRQQRDILHPHPAVERKSAGSAHRPAKEQAAAPGHPGAEVRQSASEAPEDASGAKQPASAPAKGGASAPAPQPASDKPAANPPRRIAAASPASEHFVDRQLQMAVKYLTDQLARAK